MNAATTPLACATGRQYSSVGKLSVTGAEEVTIPGQPRNGGDSVSGTVKKTRVIYVPSSIKSAVVLIAAEIDNLAGMQESCMDG
jgi:hypothetical protein